MPSSAPRACIIGHPVAQSRSPMLHGHWLEMLGIAGSYDRQDVPPEALEAFFARFAAAGYVGGNITLPHKTAIIPLLAGIDDAARIIGAVNTIWLENGSFIGGNSDWRGFMDNLDDRAPGWDKGAEEVVVLGAGGAARAVIYGMLQRGASVHIVNRTREAAETLAQHFGARVKAHGWEALPALLPRADLLANTTALGMLGKPAMVIDLAPLKPGATVADAVYVPLETDLLKAAKARGHQTVDGLGMLLHQAAFGFRHWFGGNPQVTPALRALVEADIRAKTPGA